MEADVKRAMEGIGNVLGRAVGSFFSASVDVRDFLFAMVPFGSIFMRRFFIWFPLCSLGCSLIMQTQVVVDYSRVIVEDDESEWNNDDFGSQSTISPHQTRENVSPPGVIIN